MIPSLRGSKDERAVCEMLLEVIIISWTVVCFNPIYVFICFSGHIMSSMQFVEISVEISAYILTVAAITLSYSFNWS